MNRGMSRGLESVALALIFTPEPVTTFVGLGILAVSRANKASQDAKAKISRPANRFEDYYNYRIVRSNKNSLSYKVAPIRDGQMPHTYSQNVKLYGTAEWKNYRRSTYSYLTSRNPDHENFRGIQRGLLPNARKRINHNNNGVHRPVNPFSTSSQIQHHRKIK